jgi:hypothetical protein
MNYYILAAIKAAEVGVAGIIVSNHGGRQLDYTPATITVLEEVRVYIYYLPQEILKIRALKAKVTNKAL